jgi:4-hydroxy-tetrahydrodipicolinate reductase
MSLGVSLISKLARIAAPPLEDSFDVEIIEKHHNMKADAPSGTALLLAEAVKEACASQKALVFGRQGKSERRRAGDIGIHAVRGGTLPGQHTLMFIGPDEVIEISHTIYSRAVFAAGALSAARFIAGKPPGMYGMDDLLA